MRGSPRRLSTHFLLRLREFKWPEDAHALGEELIKAQLMTRAQLKASEPLVVKHKAPQKRRGAKRARNGRSAGKSNTHMDE